MILLGIIRTMLKEWAVTKSNRDRLFMSASAVSKLDQLLHSVIVWASACIGLLFVYDLFDLFVPKIWAFHHMASQEFVIARSLFYLAFTVSVWFDARNGASRRLLATGGLSELKIASTFGCSVLRVIPTAIAGLVWVIFMGMFAPFALMLEVLLAPLALILWNWLLAVSSSTSTEEIASTNRYLGYGYIYSVGTLLLVFGSPAPIIVIILWCLFARTASNIVEGLSSEFVSNAAGE